MKDSPIGMSCDIELQRQTPTPHQMIARALFLECHRPYINFLYSLPNNSLKFEETVTELEFNGCHVGKYLFDYINSDEGLKFILDERQKIKSELEKKLKRPDRENFLMDWNTHLNYESLIMDKMINFDIIPTHLLVTRKVLPFFEQNILFKLLNQGYKLSKTKDPYSKHSQWFSQWGDGWYSSIALTKHRLVDILWNFSEKWINDFVDANQPQYNKCSEIYEVLRYKHIERMGDKQRNDKNRNIWLKDNQDKKNYFEFVLESMDYNEELRVMRSQSVYNFMRGCQRNKLNPYDEFLRFMEVRKNNIAEEYTK